MSSVVQAKPGREHTVSQFVSWYRISLLLWTWLPKALILTVGTNSLASWNLKEEAFLSVFLFVLFVFLQTWVTQNFYNCLKLALALSVWNVTCWALGNAVFCLGTALSWKLMFRLILGICLCFRNSWNGAVMFGCVLLTRRYFRKEENESLRVEMIKFWRC